MKNKTNKILAVALAVTLLALTVVVGTLAFLVDTTGNTVTNTFTVGANVNISLFETEDEAEVTARSIKYVSGAGATAKDPTLRVDKDSETCWVFVEVNATSSVALAAPGAHATAHISYEMATGWTLVADATGLNGGVIYAYTGAVDPDGTNNTEIGILKNDQVFFENRDTTLPSEQSLTFTGYAIQADGFANSGDAWTALIGQVTPTP